MPRLGGYLKQKVKEISQDERRMAQVREWIDGYHGKVVGFRGPRRAYHIVFTRAGVDLREGDYPSCEIYYRGSNEALIGVLKREVTAYSGARTGQMRAWGSLNEAARFESLL